MVVSFTCVLKLVACPLDGCLTRAHNPVRLCKYFMYMHWNYKADILKEGPTPVLWCPTCRIYMQATRMYNNKQTDR